jgi:HlyD family secretion protein
MKEKYNKFVLIIRKRRGLLTILAAVSAIIIFAAAFWGKKADASDYLTAKAERGTVEVSVSATGTVQAVTTVQVGSQASGTVSWLGVDFNSTVKKGQVIAQLDPSVFQAQVEQARANLEQARAGLGQSRAGVTDAQAKMLAAKSTTQNQQAGVSSAEANLAVLKAQLDDARGLLQQQESLARSGVISQRELISAQTNYKAAEARYNQASAQLSQAVVSEKSSSGAGQAQAQAQVLQAQAQVQNASAQIQQAEAALRLAETNLAHTTIRSPIDGIVVSRNVDVGQTVAASLQAPTLFTIANDLTKMQVLASIDEADVGQIREGIKANFAVDAFQGQTFSGEVSQVRLNAQNLQNVVTYTAVLEVANPDQKLRPGMTANITFPVEQRTDVLTVPNAALRFKPTLTEKEQEELRAQMQARREQRAQQSEQSGEQGARAQGRRGDQSANGQQENRQQESGAGDGGQRPQGQMVWVLVGKKLEPRFVRTGLTNGRVTEIVAGNLEEGATVVTGQNDGQASAARPQQSGSPLGRPGAGGRMGGGGRGR